MIGLIGLKRRVICGVGRWVRLGGRRLPLFGALVANEAMTTSKGGGTGRAPDSSGTWSLRKGQTKKELMKE